MRAFFDLSDNGRFDPGEPFEVFNDKGPGQAPDAVVAGPTQVAVNFRFGDASLYTPTPTRTATATPRATPTPAPCVGDCSGDGTVTIDELVTGVNIALGKPDPSNCAEDFDSGEDGAVTVDELVQAVNSTLHGCIGR